MSRLIHILEITDNVVNKEPWIKEIGLWKIPFLVLDSGSLLPVSPGPYR
jgi:hypothetical protein